MDGKIFNRSASSVAITNFDFDLQRFAETTDSANALFSVTTKSGETETTKYYDSVDDFDTANNFTDATSINLLKDLTLAKDISLSKTLTISDDLTLDLNGKTLNTSANIGIKVESGKTFTVDDSTSNKNGSIVHTAYDTAKTAKNNRADGNGSVGNNAIKLEDGTSENSKTSFVLKAGNIQSESVSVYAEDLTNVEINDGTITSKNSIAVYFDTNTKQTIGKNTLTMNGGKLLSTGWLPTIQVSGNFVTEQTRNTITINGGTVEYAQSGTAKNDTKNKPGDRGEGAIFASGQTALTIKDGVTVTSSHVGIEFRGGTLNVEGGTIKSTNTNNKISYHETARGTSFDDGVAIAVSRSSVEKDITVNIKGGTIQGYTALAVADPNPTAGSKPVTVNITGGTLESTSKADADEAIYLAANDEGNTATDKNGKSVALYTLKGKNAIVNFDKQVTINLSGTTVKGSVAAMLTGRTSGTGYNIGEGNDFSNFTYDETAAEKLVSFYEVKSTSPDNFTVTELGSNYGWNIKTGEDNKWQYLVKSATEDAAPAPVASLTAADTTLTLTTGSGTVTLPVDMTATTFKDLSETFKTLDASAATSTFALNAIANDNITAILGGAGNDTLTAGAAGTSLNGGAGNDYLIGGDGKDNFIYTEGKDSIEGYTSSDVVSLGAGAGTAPIDFSKLSYDGNDFIVSLGSAEQVLTFINTPEFTIGNVNYKGNSNGIEHIAQGTGISLGAGYTSKTFDGSSLAYTTIDANAVTTAGGIKITGNDNASSLIGASTGGELKGGYAGDSLKATGGSTTLNGDYGDDLLIGARGGKGSDLFVYSAGKDSIQNYGESDLVSVKGLNPADAAYSVGTVGGNTNISLDFGGGDLLVFENVIDSGVSLKGSGGKNIYTYTKDYYAINDKSVTLAANYDKSNAETGAVNTFDASKTNYETINAAAVSTAVSVMGNTLNNKIFGSKAGGTLTGGDGDDTFDLSERNTTDGGVSYVFQYTAGKDVIDGFVENKDKLVIDDATKITAAKASGDKLAFTFSSKSDVLTFKADNDIEKVDLQNGGYLTKDGVVSGTSFNLFASAKGTIDLTDTLYKDAGINVVNATAAKNQSVTLVGGTQGGAFTLAENKKKDLFEYGGGDVTISGYEAGKDRINLGNASIKSFALAGTNNSDVVLTLDNNKAMSIAGAAGHEVLIHDANSRNNSYAKTVFYANGVLHNKEKRPTIATVSAGASGYRADNSIKKIFVTGGVSGIGVYAGNNKTTLDASEADGVSLYGGNKNDKLIGSTSKADYFFYSAGKDVIENYTADEQISLTGSGLDIEDAKITLSKSSLKFKFSTKNTLTLKDSDLSTIKVDGTNYTFSKNAIGDGNGNVNLTSQFSGTYKIDAEDAGKITAVDGSAVKKNLTFKGTTAAETFTGGQKKTTFKGGGGNDTFIGNETGKDIFFYAKGETGDVTIQKFGFGTNDKLKIASGTISDISTVSGGVQFTMKKSKTDTAKAGTFKVEASKPNEVLIKANNTYYWFADSTTAGKTDGVSVGDLITADTKVTKSQANTTGYAIIDLGYSTNLTKSTVAVKAGEFTFSDGSISKK